jgi:Caspase domain/Domain of unknown function (DUF4384)
MLALSIFPGRAAQARDVALLIGVGRFSDPELDRGSRLLGTGPDLVAMKKVLVERWHFADQDVRVLRDDQATHANILAAIRALKGQTAVGDHVVVYYSGHGTSANDESNLYDLPYSTGAWVPYDFDESTTDQQKNTLIIGRRDLVPLFKDLDQSGRLVLVLSDSCFSGQVVRSLGQPGLASRYLPMRDLGVSAVKKPTPATPAPTARMDPPPYPYQHVVLISAASDSESGADIGTPIALQHHPTIDGQYHGAFTDALLRLMSGQLPLAGINLAPGQFTYTEAREAVSGFIDTEHLAQHPQLLPGIAEDPLNMDSAVFLGVSGGAAAVAAVTPQPPPPSVPAAPTARAALKVSLEGATDAVRSRVSALPNVAVVAQDGEFVVHQEGKQLQIRGAASDPVLTTTVSDPTWSRRIATQAWLNGVLPAPSDKLGLQAETSPSSRGNTFVECETFVFDVRLRKPGYLMVVDVDPQGMLTVLYPVKSSERGLLTAGAARPIPSADPSDRIQATMPFGTDEVIVLAFAHPPGTLIDLVGATPFAFDSPRARLFANGLAQYHGELSLQRIAVHIYPGQGQSSCAK